MPHLTVQPRPTPAERSNEEILVEVDEDLTLFAAAIEDWVTLRKAWEVQFREGHASGRANNVEARVLFADGEQTSSLSFRLDQLDRVDDTGDRLVLLFEERDGIAKIAYLTPNGLDVELFHIVTFT
jgi:hypothetical protein